MSFHFTVKFLWNWFLFGTLFRNWYSSGILVLFFFFLLFFCTLKSVNQLHRNSLTIHNMLIACDNRYIWIFRVCLSESYNIMWICFFSIWSTTTCHQLDAGFYRWNFSKTKIDKTHAKAIVSRDVTNTISLFFLLFSHYPDLFHCCLFMKSKNVPFFCVSKWSGVIGE